MQYFFVYFLFEKNAVQICPVKIVSCDAIFFLKGHAEFVSQHPTLTVRVSKLLLKREPSVARDIEKNGRLTQVKL